MLDDLIIDASWSFSECKPSDTSYITHGYYTYPAKFIPQLASRLIREHSQTGDIVIDPFMGSGTTLVESLVNERIGVGVDINEIAYLVAKVKTTPIRPIELAQALVRLESELQINLNDARIKSLQSAGEQLVLHERVDYWFKPAQKEDLMIILMSILNIEEKNIKDFFLLTFVQILKTCSIWLQKSVKPTRDLKKKDYNVLTTFLQQAKKMVKKNDTFYKVLKPNTIQNIDKKRIVKCNDARDLPCADGLASLIVTSPPYVTSYEYADLHQLPLYWLGYLQEEDLPQFRQKFIGSAQAQHKDAFLHSVIADAIVNQFGNNKKGREVRRYFLDMYEVFKEMYRVLKKGGRACIVIGNTAFKGVDILNAEVFIEQLKVVGFQLLEVVKREIPSKMLPSTRDSNTGQFAKATDANLTLAYPCEYILILQK